MNVHHSPRSVNWFGLSRLAATSTCTVRTQKFLHHLVTKATRAAPQNQTTLSDTVAGYMSDQDLRNEHVRDHLHLRSTSHRDPNNTIRQINLHWTIWYNIGKPGWLAWDSPHSLVHCERSTKNLTEQRLSTCIMEQGSRLHHTWSSPHSLVHRERKSKVVQK